MFDIFGFLSFFLLPYTVWLGLFILKKLTILSLKPPGLFLIGTGIYLINQSYKLFLIDLIFFISLCSKLSISSIDTIICLKNSSISLLIFTSLSFNYMSSNSIKSFPNFKRLFFTFKNFYAYLIIINAYLLRIFSQYFCFYNIQEHFLKKF